MFLWGMHVEGEIRKAEDSADNAKQIKNKVKLVLNRLLVDESGSKEQGAPPAKFRDPASMVKK